VDAIPTALARELTNNHDCTFTTADMLEDGTYVPLPNVTKEKFVAYVKGLESRAKAAAKSATMVTPNDKRRSTRNSQSNVTTHQIENERLKEQIARQSAQLEKQKSDLSRFKESLDARRKELFLSPEQNLACKESGCS